MGDVESLHGIGDPRFIAGAALFLCGMAVNLQSDAILSKLRRPGELDYKIPQGGLDRLNRISKSKGL